MFAVHLLGSGVDPMLAAKPLREFGRCSNFFIRLVVPAMSHLEDSLAHFTAATTNARNPVGAEDWWPQQPQPQPQLRSSSFKSGK